MVFQGGPGLRTVFQQMSSQHQLVSSTKQLRMEKGGRRSDAWGMPSRSFIEEIAEAEPRVLARAGVEGLDPSPRSSIRIKGAPKEPVEVYCSPSPRRSNTSILPNTEKILGRPVEDEVAASEELPMLGGLQHVERVCRKMKPLMMRKRSRWSQNY